MIRSVLTVTDQFCGAGGSSIGAVAAGAELRLAMNHWRRAIETHNQNFPDADHICADIHSVDPRRYPATDILITSPECTNHSQAKTKKHHATLLDPSGADEAERSRATMWDVPRFAEHHRYKIIIVENVEEARKWAPFSSWLMALESLGYEHQAVHMNSMVAHPTPQSRDRLYMVFWRRGNRKPDLRMEPRCWCPACEADVDGYQAFKNPDKSWGKYRQQYWYRCPRCMGIAFPYAWPALSAIDLGLPIQRIGDREKPLADATRRRVGLGIETIVLPFLAQVAGHTFERPGYSRTWPLSGPMPVMTTTLAHAVAVPARFLVSITQRRAGDMLPIPVVEPMRTQTAQQEHALVVATHYSSDAARPPIDATSRPMPTQTARAEYGVAIPFMTELRGGHSDVRPVEDPLATVTASGNHHGLVAAYIKNYGDGTDPSMVHPITDPLGAVTTKDHHALMALPFTVDYHGKGQATPGHEPLPTQDTRDRHALVSPGADISIDDCGFRMLEPHEVGRAMAFPDSYQVLGNKRERVRQYGNAVTPPVMKWLLERCVESLA